MTDYELLQQVFPEGVALRIMHFHSHPVADMLKSRIDEWLYYRSLPDGQLLEFVHYWQNARTVYVVTDEDLEEIPEVEDPED